jgi:hypothetical protein
MRNAPQTSFWKKTLHFNLELESFVPGSGRTLVRAEYGYPKGSPKDQ